MTDEELDALAAKAATWYEEEEWLQDCVRVSFETMVGNLATGYIANFVRSLRALSLPGINPWRVEGALIDTGWDDFVEGFR